MHSSQPLKQFYIEMCDQLKEGKFDSVLKMIRENQSNLTQPETKQTILKMIIDLFKKDGVQDPLITSNFLFTSLFPLLDIDDTVIKTVALEDLIFIKVVFQDNIPLPIDVILTKEITFDMAPLPEHYTAIANALRCIKKTDNSAAGNILTKLIIAQKEQAKLNEVNIEIDQDISPENILKQLIREKKVQAQLNEVNMKIYKDISLSNLILLCGTTYEIYAVCESTADVIFFTAARTMWERIVLDITEEKTQAINHQPLSMQEIIVFKKIMEQNKDQNEIDPAKLKAVEAFYIKQIEAIITSKYVDRPVIAERLLYLCRTEKMASNKISNKLTAIEQLISLIDNPWSLDQGQYAYCGIATFSVQLLINAPELFVKMATDLLVDGYTETPVPLKMVVDMDVNEISVTNFILCTLRYNTNLIFKNPISTFKPQNPEGIVGQMHMLFYDTLVTTNLQQIAEITRPREIVDLLKMSGYTAISDTTFVHNMQDKELSIPMRAIAGGVYPDEHQFFGSRQENFEHTYNAIHSHRPQGDAVIFLLRVGTLREIIPEVKSMKTIPVSNEFDIELTHFLNVKSCHWDKNNNMLDLTVYTYGKEYVASMPIDEFIKGFDGAIIAHPPTPESIQTLLNKNEHHASSPGFNTRATK